MNRCRCRLGNCIKCNCVTKLRTFCTDACGCDEDLCVKRRFELDEPEPVRMNNDALNDALAALAANQGQLYMVLAAIADRLAQPAPPVVVPPQLHVQPAVLEPDVKYSGSPHEDFGDWLKRINRRALSDKWTDQQKRRAAAGSLAGSALVWHDEIGTHLNDWNGWIQALRAAFEVRLTLNQWVALVENRQQQPDESGTHYVLKKVKLCRRCPNHLNEHQIVPYLIRGLSNANHVSVMMGNPPLTIADFLIELRRLEEISNIPPLAKSAEVKPASGSTQPDLHQQIQAIAEKFSSLTSIVERGEKPKQVTFSDRRPPGARNEIKCYACQGFGHYARDCPSAASASAVQGNEQAGLLRQGRH